VPARAVLVENVLIALAFATSTRKNTIQLLRTKALRDFTTTGDPVSSARFIGRKGELVLVT
jgi:hypothetical protein